jgi:Predicted Fe-S oxidoreductases
MIKSLVPTPFPSRLTIEATSRCNLGCLFCPRHLVKMALGDMDWGLYCKIIDEAAQHLPVTLVLFFRGESLIHPRLAEMIKYAKERGLGPIQLASNGFLLTPERGRELIEAGLDFISFSLDTNDETVYGQTRLKSDLAIARNNVVNFVKLASEMEKAGHKRPEIQVSSVDVADYRAGQADFIDFWRQYADRVRIYVEHSADGNLGSISPSLADHTLERKACQKVFSDMVIYWDGTVALCNHDWATGANLCNVSENSIADVWDSPPYNEIRRAHQEGRIPEALACAKCDHWRMYYSSEGFLGQVYEKKEPLK